MSGWIISTVCTKELHVSASEWAKMITYELLPAKKRVHNDLASVKNNLTFSHLCF